MPTLISLAAAVLLAGCTPPPHHQGPKQINTPADAVQSTPAPRQMGHARGNTGLTSDVEQLKDARSTYKRAQERRRARVKRKQARCHKAENKKEVPINEGGQSGARFCQQTD